MWRPAIVVICSALRKANISSPVSRWVPFWGQDIYGMFCPSLRLLGYLVCIKQQQKTAALRRSHFRSHASLPFRTDSFTASTSYNGQDWPFQTKSKESHPFIREVSYCYHHENKNENKQQQDLNDAPQLCAFPHLFENYSFENNTTNHRTFPWPGVGCCKAKTENTIPQTIPTPAQANLAHRGEAHICLIINISSAATQKLCAKTACKLAVTEHDR